MKNKNLLVKRPLSKTCILYNAQGYDYEVTRMCGILFICFAILLRLYLNLCDTI